VKSALVVFAYNRPSLLRSTIASLQHALDACARLRRDETPLEVIVAVDGPNPRSSGDAARVEAVTAAVMELLPGASVRRQSVNRGLPAHLLDVMGEVTLRAERVICVEDDLDVSPALLLALLHESDRLAQRASDAAHVIGAAPLHRDGSVEHQALLITRAAYAASEPLLRDYVARFALDGASNPGGYGRRNDAAIYAWSGEIARESGLPAPRGTSQDRMRELAWRRAGVAIDGLPMRLVRHRGLWGQHNTPWHALRTGQLFQRIDSRPWEAIEAELLRRAR